jgi:hypothetical protein
MGAACSSETLASTKLTTCHHHHGRPWSGNSVPKKNKTFMMLSVAHTTQHQMVRQSATVPHGSQWSACKW